MDGLQHSSNYYSYHKDMCKSPKIISPKIISTEDYFRRRLFSPKIISTEDYFHRRLFSPKIKTCSPKIILPKIIFQSPQIMFTEDYSRRRLFPPKIIFAEGYFPRKLHNILLKTVESTVLNRDLLVFSV